MLSAIKAGLGMIISPLTDIIKRKQELTAATQASKLAINEAKTTAQITKIATGQTGDIAWENTSIENSGWKDEWFTILLSIPAILCFIPAGANIVADGFAALATCPDWYRWAFGIAVGSAFGIKEITKLKNIMKGD